MRGMILAAGRGQRMGSLTLHKPKPLIEVKGRPLIEYSISALVKMGIKDIVINLSYLGEQIKEALGTGKRYGVNLHYSNEPELLETGGGVFQALPLLGKEPFIVLSADVITDFPLEKLRFNLSGLAHLVLVDNPTFHPNGDFSLENGIVFQKSPSEELRTFTFSNIGIYRPELFEHCKPGKFRLGDLLKQAITQNKVTGEYYKGIWYNLGTEEELTKVSAVPDIRF